MSQESKFKCPEGEYWDGLLRKCYSCLKVCELDKTYCCRNCPAFCEIRIPNSANNVGISLTTIKDNLDENQDSAISLPLHTLVIIIAIIILLAAVCLAICCFIRCLAKAKQHSSSDTEVVKPLKANDPEEGSRERQPSDASTTSRETSLKCCHFVSQEDGRKLINQGITHSHINERFCSNNRYCPQQQEHLHNKICKIHQSICQASLCSLNHYQEDTSGYEQCNKAAQEELGPDSERSKNLNFSVKNHSENKCRTHEEVHNKQNYEMEDQSLSDIEKKPDSQVLYVDKGEGEVCYITKLQCDDIL